MAPLRFAALASLTTVLGVAQLRPDSVSMCRVALLPSQAWGGIPCGDADRDGRRELYACGPAPRALYAWEHRGGNVFDSAPLGFLHGRAWSLGDGDRDGKADLLLSPPDSGGPFMFAIRESPDSFSLPCNEVWRESLYLEVPDGVVFADLDVDSACEVLLMQSTLCVVRLYENRGDNSYDSTATVRSFVMSFSPAPDLDRDGLPELAVSSFGRVEFYEAAGDDSLRYVARCWLASSSHDVLALASAGDMDRDGRPELVALVSDWDADLAIMESPCDDSFELVWSRELGPATWPEGLAAGDVDGDSVEEFATFDGYGVSLWHCTGNDSYEQLWWGSPYWAPLTIYDINSDGKAELICHCDSGLAILEWLPVGVAERGQRRVEHIVVEPSVVRSGAGVRVSGLGAGAEVEVVDVTGRTVARPAVGSTDEAVWQTRPAPPGAYFVRITSGSHSITRKVLVVE